MSISDAERAAYRYSLVKSESPWIAGAIAIVTFALAVFNAVIGAHPSVIENLPVAIAAVIMMVVALIVGRDWIPAAVVPWIVAAMSVILVGALQLQEGLYTPPTGLAYSLLVLVPFAPVTLSYRATLVAGVPMMAGSAWVATRLTPAAAVDWMVVCLAAFSISCVLLWMRMRSVDALAASMAYEKTLATEDPLTGLLNRRGIEARVPQMFALSLRQQVPISALFVDIDGLKKANDLYGHDFGDEVICATADAIKAMVRAEDLVARWGGDEFVILGLGFHADATTMNERIQRNLAESGVSAQKWAGTVTVGGATADARATTFNELMRRADKDMYSHRAESRAFDQS
ncbi:MAG: GGDEF domain-containing protein [Candidatus Nanopelagicales bacterium]